MDLFVNKIGNVISNSVISVSNSVSQLSNVLPGNPLSREYDIESHICSAGIGKH
jgi:SCY1-like protein 2